MSGLPEGATRRSEELLTLAHVLAASCPEGLAREIALTGSAARGWADEHSDIELNLWVERMPQREEWVPWLQSVGATTIDISLPLGPNGWMWTGYRFRGVWIEMGFATLSSQEEWLTRIAAGEVTQHEQIVLASTMRDAVALRSQGWIEGWQRRLEIYPDGLAEKIIQANTSVWSDPHVPPVRWALADRHDLLALSLRLQWDIGNLFRVLFAANQTWEPDEKWLARTTEGLSLKPDRLVERLDNVLSLQDPHRSVAAMFALILDMLALVPERYDVSKARESVLAAARSRTG
jgi:hypothetical protein